MKKVITYGTFDLLHSGHINILKRAKDLGDYLIVGISTDEFNLLKGKKSYFSYEERKLLVESLKYVDEVIPEKDWQQKVLDVVENNVDIFVMGNDWEGQFDFLKEYCQVVYFPRTQGISTTKIKLELKCM
ncbi:MAG: glycerol-3-phosphate cytidylyltransferase [Bacillus anthracis]